MWISHFAPSLILHKYSPETPLGLLAFAGALPDFTFFCLALLGIEGIQYSDKSQDPTYTNPTGGKGSGCFPYDCDYPWSHSLVGEVALGLIFAFAATFFRKLPSSSILYLFLATLTHYPLDLLVHRHDMSITPSEPPSYRHGFPLFDYPSVLFASDLIPFLIALYLHKQPGKANKIYAWAAVLATGIQADFSFLGAPGTNARWVHGPIFAGEILLISWGMEKMASYAGTAQAPANAANLRKERRKLDDKDLPSNPVGAPSAETRSFSSYTSGRE